LACGISKAFLLAAGTGTRLRPITDHTPKCLVPIHGQPLLSIWLSFCEQQRIREVLINTHHLAGQVRDWAGKQNSGVKINLFHEEILRGSAGTIAANRDFIGNNEHFYVFYADNLVRTDLARLQSQHSRHSGVLSMGLFKTPKPRDCGIVTLDPSGRITAFEEKPAKPRSDLAFAGVLIARTSLFDYLPQSGFGDLGKDVLPKLVGQMWGQILEGYLLDVGTPENYERALAEWPSVRSTGADNRAVCP
jgi:mannose-1-phosphate guanylyltransferase